MIPPETIALIRERTNIVAVIQESVPSLKKRGRSWVGLCPFHKEKTPSFHVNPDRGFFHCFGCKEGGSAIDFLMKHDGLTFPEAVRDLAERCGIEVREEDRPAPEADRQRKHKDDLYGVLQVAATFYEQMLREHPDRAYAVEELEKRGVAGADAADTLQAFRMGYAPGAWDALAQHLRGQGISPALAEQVGLLVPRQQGSGHYDRFRHRLMFAVVDPQGRVVAFSGRALRDLPAEPGAAPRDPPPKYINSPESPIYTKGNLLFGLFQARHAIRHEDLAVLVEGNFDVVSLHARGMTNVVAPLGTAFTDEQAKLLRRYAGNVVLCFDGDAAGRKATALARGPLRAAGLGARVAALPAGSDPDDLARTRGIDAVKDAVAQARGLLEFLLEDLLDANFNNADAYEKSARVQHVGRVLAEEDDPLVRSTLKLYVDQLAGRLDLVTRDQGGRGERSPETFRALEGAVKRALAQAQARDAQRAQQPSGQRPMAPQHARVSSRNPGGAARGAIVGALIEYPELLTDPGVEVACQLLEGDSARTVAALAACTKSSPEGEKTLDSAEFLAQMPPAIHAFAAQRLAAPRLESVDEAREVVLSNADKLKSMMVERQASELSREQRQAADWEAEIELAREAELQAKGARGLGRNDKGGGSAG